jgi:hypothetical protein
MDVISTVHFGENYENACRFKASWPTCFHIISKPLTSCSSLGSGEGPNGLR